MTGFFALATLPTWLPPLMPLAYLGALASMPVPPPLYLFIGTALQGEAGWVRALTGLASRRLTEPKAWNGSSTLVPVAVGLVVTTPRVSKTSRTCARTPGSAASSAATIVRPARKAASATGNSGSRTKRAATSSGARAGSSGSCFCSSSKRRGAGERRSGGEGTHTRSWGENKLGVHQQ